MSLSRIRELWSGLDTRSQVTLVGGLVAVLATFYVLYGFASRQSFATLASGLDPAKTGQAEQARAAAGLSYRVAGGGTELDVPTGQLAQARVALAEKGVLDSSGDSFKVFDKASFGATDFQQQVQYQQALQQQVAGTIEQIQGVNRASVELVLPEDRLFADSSAKATAAVLVDGGSALPAATIQGIAHLVASSVKGLRADDVSIADETGALLWPPAGAGAGGEPGAASKLQADRLYASELSAQVNALLDSTLGPGKALARVHADLDADRSTIDRVTYAKKGVPLSQQTQTETLQSKGGGAVLPAGTKTNTSGASYAGTTGSNGSSQYRNTTETTTYGVDKTVEHSVVAPGNVRKLDVALVVDRSVPAGQVASLQRSVASLVGLTPKRGDTIAVSRIDFAKPPAPGSGGGPLAALGNPLSLAKDGVLALLAVGFLVAMRRALARREREASVPSPTWLRELEGGVTVAELEAGPSAPQLPPALAESRSALREQIEEIASTSPEAIAGQVAQWMKE